MFAEERPRENLPHNPKNNNLKSKLLPQSATTEQLLEMLGSTNIWQAETAHRLLYERGYNPRAKNVRELWLSSRKNVDWNLIYECLNSNNWPLRENALILSGSNKTPEFILKKMILMAANDTHPRIRFQAVLSLGNKSHLKNSVHSLIIFLLTPNTIGLVRPHGQQSMVRPMNY